MDTDVSSGDERQAIERDAPDQPTDLPRRAWPGVLKRTMAGQVGSLVGVGSAAVQVWDIAKWPVLALVVVLILAILTTRPTARSPRSPSSSCGCG